MKIAPKRSRIIIFDTPVCGGAGDKKMKKVLKSADRM